MYFEEFDLSERLKKRARIIHHPKIRIVHYGGDASRKGLVHLRYFCKSYLTYSVKHFFSSFYNTVK